MLASNSRVMVLGVGCLVLLPPRSGALTIHVPADESTIQGAIHAATDGDEVVIAPGRYGETVDFLGKGITVRGTDPSDSVVVAATIVDGGGAGSVFTFDSGEGRASVLAGLTLTGGSGTVIHQGRWGGVSTAGGGVYIEGASPRVEDCVVRDNAVSGGWITTGGMGGGISCSGGGIPLIARTRIERNSSTKHGGGIAADGETRPTVLESAVLDNEATPGGNWAASGGGIFLRGTPSARIIRSEVRGNRAQKDGGGLYAKGADFTLLHAIFAGNTASGDFGGGADVIGGASGDIVNTIFAQNDAPIGAGVQVHDSSVELENCTFVGNVAGIRGGAIFDGDRAEVRATNCVLWYDTPDEIDSFGTQPDVTYSSIRGGWNGQGNVACGPRFVAYKGFELILGVGSTCIDAGDPQIEDGLSDWHPRWPAWYPDAPRSDMGAYGGPRNGDWLP